MPFDKTQVKPEVAALLKVRDYIAAHGFSPELGAEGCARCFLGSAESVGAWVRGASVGALQLIADELAARYGNAPRTIDREFDHGYLQANRINAPIALEIIDAAIARVS